MVLEAGESEVKGQAESASGESLLPQRQVSSHCVLTAWKGRELCGVSSIRALIHASLRATPS